MNPLPDDDGDQYLVPTNMTTPELLANPPKPAPMPTPPEALPLEPKPNGNGDKARFKEVFRRLFAETMRRSLQYDRKDPAKLERLVSMSFAAVMDSMARFLRSDVDVALHYAGLLHARLPEWAAEMDRRAGQDAPMSEVLERELDLAYSFIAEKVEAA